MEQAIDEAREVRNRLFDAHRDHLDRTSRLLQFVLAVLAGVLGVATLVAQPGLVLAWPAAVAAVAGTVAILTASVLLVAAYSGLPQDSLMSQGVTPGQRMRFARDMEVDREAWLVSSMVSLTRQVEHNAEVVAALVRRRDRALIWLAAGAAAVAVAAVFLVGGDLHT